MRKNLNIFGMILLLFLLVACQQPSNDVESTPQPTATQTLLPTVGTAVSPSPTPTIPPTETPLPATETAVSPTPLPPTETPDPEPTEISAPTMLNNKPRPIEITKESITHLNGEDGTRYVFSEYVRFADMYPNGNMVGFTKDGLAIIDIENGMITPLVDNIRAGILTPHQSEYIFVSTQVDWHQLAPIWAISTGQNEPNFLGLTAGLGLEYSATKDGHVLMVEDGHLVLKWIEDGIVQSKALEAIEDKLNLNWDQVDFSQEPYTEGTPLIETSISPDGEWIAVFDGLRNKFWIVSIDGETVQDVSFPTTKVEPPKGPWLLFLDWSPDSKWFGYRVSVWDDNRYVTKRPEYWDDLKVVTVGNDTAPITLTQPEESHYERYVGHALTWSPDSKYVAFGARDSMYYDYLFLANGDGTNIQKVSDLYDSDSNKSIYWSVDGSLLYYKCKGVEVDKTDLCTLNLDD